MGKVDEVNQLVVAIQRNYPDFASTFATCPNHETCKNRGRGGRYCADCCESQLAELVGPGDARKFHEIIRERSDHVKRMFNHVRHPSFAEPE